MCLRAFEIASIKRDAQGKRQDDENEVNRPSFGVDLRSQQISDETPKQQTGKTDCRDCFPERSLGRHGR